MPKRKKAKKSAAAQPTIVLKDSASFSADAAALIAAIDAVIAQVPNAVFLKPAQRREMLPIASRSDEFLEAVAVMLQRFPQIAELAEVDAAQLRALIRFRKGFDPLGTRFDMGGEMVRDTLTATSFHYVHKALDAYDLGQAFARREGEGELARLVAAIRKELPSGGGSGRRTAPPRTKKTPAPPDEAKPTP